VAPSNLVLTAPASVARGQSFQLTGTFTDSGPADTYVGTIQWGDGTTSGFTASVRTTGREFSASHSFAAAGVYEVTVRVEDDDGGVVFSSTVITVTQGTGTAVRGGVLELSGSPARDNIAVTLSGSRIVVNATYGSTRSNLSFPRASVQRIVANLAEGDDALRVDSRLRLRLMVDAGAGNDRITAGGGPSVIVGGDGNDLLYGKSGRDILIGGGGRDQLWGYGASDLLINGRTNYDNNTAALTAILAEWTSARGVLTRVNNINTGAGPVLTGTGIRLVPQQTALHDAEIDLLMGGTDADWFLIDLGRDVSRDRGSDPTN
jgi:Ca2+-binding RTX toxin-like protein